MDILSLNTLFEIAGGRYALSVLSQKRTAALMKGAVPLVEDPPHDLFLTTLVEIQQGKICLGLPEKRKEIPGK